MGLGAERLQVRVVAPEDGGVEQDAGEFRARCTGMPCGRAQGEGSFPGRGRRGFLQGAGEQIGHGSVAEVLIAAGEDVLLVVEYLPEYAEDIAELPPQLDSFAVRPRQYGRHGGDHREGAAGLSAVGRDHRVPGGGGGVPVHVAQLPLDADRPAGGHLGRQAAAYGLRRVQGADDPDREHGSGEDGGHERLVPPDAVGAGRGVGVGEVVEIAGRGPPQHVQGGERDGGRGISRPGAVDQHGEHRQGMPQFLMPQQGRDGFPGRARVRGGGESADGGLQFLFDVQGDLAVQIRIRDRIHGLFPFRVNWGVA